MKATERLRRKGVLLLAGTALLFSAVSGMYARPVRAGSPEGKPLRITKELVKEVEPVGSFLWLTLKDGREVLISSDGRFVIYHPRLYDMKKNKIVTTLSEFRAVRKPEIDRYAFFYLSKTGKPKALLVVDEYCPYCERFMKDLLSLLEAGRKPKYDLAVTFYPVHREAIDASCKLLGLPPEKARETYVKWVKTTDPAVWKDLTCDPKKQQEFLIKAAGLRFESGVNSTPTVILPDGRKVIGYRNPEDFLFEAPSGKTSGKPGTAPEKTAPKKSE